MPKLAGRSFGFDFSGPLPTVWSAMADTARYNEAAGLPKHKVTETVRPDGTVAFIARGKVGPFELEWEDLPCNWVRGRWVEHRRRFRRGPIEVLNARLDLTPAGQGCHGDYRVEVAPRGLVGRALLAGGFLGSAERMFKRLAAQADRFARGEQAQPFAVPVKPLRAEARQRLDRLTRQLEGSAHGHGLARRLAREIAEVPEVDAERIRPLALARRWGVPERHAVEACLEATRLGLLELRWDLLCPRCRGC